MIRFEKWSNLAAFLQILRIYKFTVILTVNHKLKLLTTILSTSANRFSFAFISNLTYTSFRQTESNLTDLPTC